MGLVLRTALGSCCAAGARVLALTGDGEMLMGIGSLGAWCAGREEFSILVLDNESFGETGRRPV